MMLTYWTCGLMNDCNGITRGMNRPLVPMLITLIGVVVPRIIWNLLIFQKTVTYGGADLAFRWLILTYPASWVLSGIVAYLYYRHVLKQVCRLAAHTPSHE